MFSDVNVIIYIYNYNYLYIFCIVWIAYIVVCEPPGNSIQLFSTWYIVNVQ